MLSVNAARKALNSGGVVAVPTDTVWGLALDPWAVRNPNALAAMKGRPASKPIAWLVAGFDDLAAYGADYPPAAQRLANAFWPGALTLVVPASPAVPRPFRAPQGTIGLRWARCAALQDLIEACGHPLAVTSANRAGQPPALSVQNIPKEMLAACAGALNAAEKTPSVNVASTVVRCVGDDIELLREGAIGWNRIEAVLDGSAGETTGA